MDARNKFLSIEKEMNQIFLERRTEVRSLLVTLLARQAMCLLGPPGTGKSAMSNNLCKRIGGKYFYAVLSKQLPADDIFGPMDLIAYAENREFKRFTDDTLVDSEIAFLDEIWKCNSSTLNMLLPVLEERKFKVGRQVVDIPLEMAVAASNELPEDKEELGALWDRFLLRLEVAYIKDAKNRLKLLNGMNTADSHTTLTLDELKAAQAEAAKVSIRKVAPTMISLGAKLAEEKISISDRRWVKLLTIIKANAWLEGRTEASSDDLEVLANALWQEPNQIGTIRKIILGMVNPTDMIVQDLQDQAMEIFNNAMVAAASNDANKKTAAGMEANGKLTNITEKLDKLMEEAKQKGRATAKIEEAILQVAEFNKECAVKCLGMRHLA